MKDFLVILLAVVIVLALAWFLVMVMGFGTVIPFLGAALAVALLCYIIYLLREQNEDLKKRLDKLEKLLSEKKSKE